MNDPELTTQAQQKVHGFMTIMRAVAETLCVTTADIMGGKRTGDLVRARVAVYKIATDLGYNPKEIAYFINRNRASSYNYNQMLRLYYDKEERFNAIYAAALLNLDNLPPRAPKPRKPRNFVIKQAILERHTQTSVPAMTFQDTKLALGWKFKAEEELQMQRAKVLADRFMRNFGKTSEQHPRQNYSAVAKVYYDPRLQADREPDKKSRNK